MIVKSANKAVHLTPTPALFTKFCCRLPVHLYYIGHYRVGASDLCVRHQKEVSLGKVDCGSFRDFAAGMPKSEVIILLNELYPDYEVYEKEGRLNTTWLSFKVDGKGQVVENEACQ
ncbi:hypothetical protein L4D76_25485 [Photobacterium sagamiensis]|uniref:hypothetical protein n=1 Tax=Photobacterium sagamiensis TaxID=2910241 RepID=UPI003D1171F8